MVQNHGIFQGYYFFHHIGLDRNARDQFRGHPHFEYTAQFCHLYDQPAFDGAYDAMPLDAFVPMMHRVMERRSSRCTCARAASRRRGRPRRVHPPDREASGRKVTVREILRLIERHRISGRTLVLETSGPLLGSVTKGQHAGSMSHEQSSGRARRRSAARWRRPGDLPRPRDEGMWTFDNFPTAKVKQPTVSRPTRNGSTASQGTSGWRMDARDRWCRKTGW